MKWRDSVFNVLPATIKKKLTPLFSNYFLHLEGESGEENSTLLLFPERDLPYLRKAVYALNRRGSHILRDVLCTCIYRGEKKVNVLYGCSDLF